MPASLTGMSTASSQQNQVPDPVPCERDPRPPKAGHPEVTPLPPHAVLPPDQDQDLQTVLRWFHRQDNLLDKFTRAVEQAVYYILDGSTTGRVYLHDPEVDSDERSAVGTNLQYRVLNVLGLPKEPPLDTVIEGISVDVKTTTRKGYSWMIPPEAQCELCLLLKVDAREDRFAVYLMRTHRVGLNKGNQDKKRSTSAAYCKQYMVPLFEQEWLPLQRNPLRDLTPEQRTTVLNLDPRKRALGQEKRLKAMFSYLPNRIIPRYVFTTIGANRDDPLRRARAVRPAVFREHGLVVLCGTWAHEREAAKSAGFDLRATDWVALPPEAIDPELLPTVIPED